MSAAHDREPYRPTPDETLRWAVDRAILAHVRESHGEHAVRSRPLRGSTVLSADGPTDYRHGIEAARIAAAAARNEMYSFVRKARGAGIAWGDLAQPLGIEAGPDESAAEKAFELAAGPRDPWADRTVGWDCADCGAWITDHGPYNGHPDDCETGHTDTCERHAAAVYDWQEAYG